MTKMVLILFLVRIIRLSLFDRNPLSGTLVSDSCKIVWGGRLGEGSHPG